MILRAKFHVVSIAKNSDVDASVKVPVAFPLKIILTRNRKYGKCEKCLFLCNYALTRRFDSGTFTKKSLGCILARVSL